MSSLTLQLQKHFAPILLIHRDEPYKPVSIEYLLQRSCLMQGAPPQQRMVMPGPTVTNLMEHNTNDYYLSILPSAWTGQHMESKHNAYTAPMYSHAYYIPEGQTFRSYQSTKEEPLLVFQYFFLYGYNGPKRLFDCNCSCCTCACCNRGDHIYDLENLDVLVKAPSSFASSEHKNDEKSLLEYQILEVRFGAHRERDGVWRKYDQVQKMKTAEGIKIVAYAAVSSHGVYPDSGCYFPGCGCCQPKYGFPRICCAANDYVDPHGDLWLPINVQSFDSKDQVISWNDFIGGFESYQMGDSPRQHTYYGNSPETSSNCCLRLCCPCL